MQAVMVSGLPPSKHDLRTQAEQEEQNLMFLCRGQEWGGSHA